MQSREHGFAALTALGALPIRIADHEHSLPARKSWAGTFYLLFVARADGARLKEALRWCCALSRASGAMYVQYVHHAQYYYYYYYYYYY
jgi:hypothetical protein